MNKLKYLIFGLVLPICVFIIGVSSYKRIYMDAAPWYLVILSIASIFIVFLSLSELKKMKVKL